MTLVVDVGTKLVSIQDLGRTGHMHEGIPPGGAIVRSALIAANREAANRDDAPALEVFGVLRVRAERRTEVATPDGARILEAGETLSVMSNSWTYLAVRGGIAVPEVLGGRGALPGIDAVKRGDRIESAGEPAVRFGRPPQRPTGMVRVLPGPDVDAFGPEALATLCEAPYKMRMPGRVGARLEGAVIARAAGFRERSRPMVRGAIQVPPDGMPIVLGPDHPTTGGYPVLAVVVSADLDRVFATELFAMLQFTTTIAVSSTGM